jgi:hypothetical protein
LNKEPPEKEPTCFRTPQNLPGSKTVETRKHSDYEINPEIPRSILWKKFYKFHYTYFSSVLFDA